MGKACDSAKALARGGSSERRYHLNPQLMRSSYAACYLIDYAENLIGFIAEIAQARSLAARLRAAHLLCDGRPRKQLRSVDGLEKGHKRTDKRGCVNLPARYFRLNNAKAAGLAKKRRVAPDAHSSAVDTLGHDTAPLCRPPKPFNHVDSARKSSIIQGWHLRSHPASGNAPQAPACQHRAHQPGGRSHREQCRIGVGGLTPAAPARTLTPGRGWCGRKPAVAKRRCNSARNSPP